MPLDSLLYQFNISDFVVRKITEGMSHETSMVQPQVAGNCANWVMGHIVLSRLSGIEMLGGEPPYPKEKFERYKQGTSPLTDDADAIPFAELMTCYRDTHAVLMDSLQSATEDQLQAAAPFSPTNNPDDTIGSLLAGLVYHEAYHVGQIALQRRVAGLPRGLG